MATILRKEWFGGLLGSTSSYDIRVVNKFTYSKWAESLRETGELTNQHIALLSNADYNITNRGINLISDNHTNAPLLSAPIILWLELTSACPLKCKHCFINSTQTKAPIQIPFDAVERILEEAAKMGVMRVTLSGGEAFSYPHIERTISKINDLGLGLRIFTNGVIEKPTIDWLRKYRVDTLFVSVDGLQDHHDFLRGKNVFAHVEKTIEQLSDTNSIQNITLSISLDTYNATHFKAMFSFGKKYGIKSFLLRPLMGYSWTDRINNLVFTDKSALSNALEKIEELAGIYNIECQINKIPHMPLNKIAFSEDHVDSASIWNILGIENSIDCVGGNLVCGIKYDGTVSPCGFIKLKHESSPNNSIYHRSLKELWQNASNLGAMRGVKINEDCSSCSIVGLCNGGCRANSYNMSNDISGLDPYCVYHDTAYGKKLFDNGKFNDILKFPLAEERYFISKKRLVSKCGWATYE